MSILALLSCSEPQGSVPPGSVAPAEWGRTLDVQVAGVAADGSGNVYVTGALGFEPADLGGGALDPADGYSYLARYAGDGEHRWSEALPLDQTIYGLAADEQGRTWLGGAFRDELTLGGHTVSGAGGDDAYVAGFGSDGSALATWSEGGVGQDNVRALAAGGGRVGVVGWQSGNAEDTDWAAQVLSLEDDGRVRWEHLFGESDGGQNQWADRVAVNAVGEVLVAGGFDDTLDIDGSTWTGGGSYLALFDDEGAIEWARQTDTVFESITLDTDGNVYAVIQESGGYWYTYRIVSYDSAGGLRWEWALPEKTFVTAPLQVGPDGSVWFGGGAGTLGLGDGSAAPSEDGVPFVAALSTDGEYQRSRLLEPSYTEACPWFLSTVYHVALGPDDQVVVEGDLCGSITVGDTTIGPVDGGLTPFVASLLVP